jgi:DNA-binding CsgD family transcriptional regulator
MIGRGSTAARRRLARLRWPADVNTSMLLVTALAGRASVLCADRDTARAVLPTLVRFAGHVAVDPEALWVEGPVGLIGAQVAQFLGDGPLAARRFSQAEACNQHLDCARTSATLVEMRRHDGRRMVLPEREHAVLRLLADGLGNAQIARVLNFSVSTIRRETTSLYQRLGWPTGQPPSPRPTIWACCEVRSVSAAAPLRRRWPPRNRPRT